MIMTTERIKTAFESIKFHTCIFFKGIARTIYGTAVSAAIAMAIFGFRVTIDEVGYDAVGDFVASCALLGIALWNVYAMGGKKRSGKK